MRYLLGKRRCQKITADRPELQIALVEEYANLSQRGPRADRIDATSQPGTDVTASHPFRHRSESSLDIDFEEQQTAISHPAGDFEMTPEKRVQRVFNRYNALVAGIMS